MNTTCRAIKMRVLPHSKWANETFCKRLYIARFIRSWLASRQSLVVENLALRSQLALFEHQVIADKRKKPKATPAFRQLWTVLSRYYVGWESVLVVFKPDTIVRWHDRAFRLYWKHKSKPKGRPTLSKDIIDSIKQVHEQNPLWSCRLQKLYPSSICGISVPLTRLLGTAKVWYSA